MASEIRVNQIQNRSGLTTVTWNDEGLNVVGVVTASSFSGPITGTTGNFGGDVTISGDLGVAGTLTYEDVARVDATGLSTFREGFGVGPLAGIALTAYKDGSIRTTGIITATTYYGSGSNLTGIDATQIVTGNTSVQTVDTGSDGHVKVTTEGSERVRIDSNGKVLIGTTNVPSNKNTVTPSLNVSGSGVLGAAQITRHTGVGGGGALLHLAGTRGSDVNSYTILQNNDGIGTLAFNAADGNEFVTAAEVSAQVDGTPGDNDMPGRLLFKTTADGASSPTERLRIDSAGEVLIGATARGREKGLHLAGANQDPGGVWTQMGIYSTDSQAAGKGGSIGFGGQDGSLDKQQFAAIKGAKENGTSGNYAGYMSFYTRPNGNVTAERLRIGQNSNNSPVGSFGTGSSHLNNNTNPDRASFKVGGRLHVEGAFGHNAMCGLYYNCYSGGNDLFYGGTYTPSGGDGRASAITMRYGGVAILTDSSSTAYSPTTQITTMGTALSVGRDGYVTTPKNPCVSMSVSSSYKDSHYLQHSTVNTNIGNHYNTSTAIFTCPVAGLYFCSLMVMSNNSNDTMDFELHKDGGNMNSILVPYNAPTGGSYNQVTGQTIIYCDSGDELRFKRNNGSVYAGRHSNITFALIG